MSNKRIVFVVPYTCGTRTRYTIHYTERAAKVWGFHHMAKTGEHFTVMPMIEAEAFRLR